MVLSFPACRASIRKRWKAGAAGLDFRTAAGVDNAYAALLVEATLKTQPLPHY